MMIGFDFNFGSNENPYGNPIGSDFNFGSNQNPYGNLIDPTTTVIDLTTIMILIGW